MAHHAYHELNAAAIAVMIMSVLITGAKTNAISMRQQQSCFSCGSSSVSQYLSPAFSAGNIYAIIILLVIKSEQRPADQLRKD